MCTVKWLNWCIWHINGTLSGTTTPGLSETGCNDNEEVLRVPPNPWLEPHHQIGKCHSWKVFYPFNICRCLPIDKTWHKVSIEWVLGEGKVGHELRLEPCLTMLVIHLEQCEPDEPRWTWTQICVQARMPDYTVNWTAKSSFIKVSYPFAEIQLMYSTAPADWAHFFWMYRYSWWTDRLCSDLKVALMKVQCSLIRGLMLYDLELGHNTKVATKNICCAEGEVTVDQIIQEISLSF